MSNRENSFFTIIGLGYKNNAIKQTFFEVVDGRIPNAQVVDPFIFPNRFISFLHRIVYSGRLRKYFRWFPKTFWEKYHVLNHIEVKPNQKHYFLLAYGTDLDKLHFPDLLRKFKETHKDNVSLVLLLFDSVDSPLMKNGWGNLLEQVKLFDIVASYDQVDSSKYGFMHFYDSYAERTVVPSQESSDIFFVGGDKGRAKMLYDIAKYLSDGGVDVDIRVTCLADEYLTKGMNNITKYMTYDITLGHVLSTNCLLEVLCEGQNSSSLRYYEAVVYNKKLLTNDPNIINMPYYNPDTMKYFKNPEDIDIEWVKKKDLIDYHYKGEFSINTLFSQIINYK